MAIEWLLIAYTALDENLNFIQGEVLKHSPDADDIYDALPQYGVSETIRRTRAVAIEYVGELPKNVAFITMTPNLPHPTLRQPPNRSDH